MALVVKTVTGIRPLSFTPGAEPLTLEVPGLADVKLMQHQILAIKHALSIIDTGRLVDASGTVEIVSSALMLSMALGSGKTFIAIAILLLRKDPLPRPQQLYTPYHKRVTRKLTGKRVKLRCSVVVVAKHILFQWAETLKRHTSLNVFLLYDAHRLHEFIGHLRTGDINNFDVIIAKTDPVAGYGFGIPGESDNQQTRSMAHAVAALLQDHIVPWVIYDDFDTAGLDKRTPIINAARSLFISATSDHRDALQRNVLKEAEWPTNPATVMRDIGRMNPPILAAPHDPHLSGPLNIRVSDEAIRQSREMPKVITYEYSHTCADAEVITLLSALGCDESAMEMLNGEATTSAADRLGIKADSVAGIFEKTLGNAHENYAILTRQHKIYTQLTDSGIYSVLKPHPFKTYTDAQLNTIIRHLDAMPEPPELMAYLLADKQLYESDGDADAMARYENAFAALEKAYVKAVTKNVGQNEAPVKQFWSTDALGDRIAERTSEIAENQKAVGKSIEKVRENFREGRCGVCRKPHADNCQLYINKCCSLICCTACGVESCRYRKQYNYKTNKSELFGSCPGCRAMVKPLENMIFVEDIDILSILDGAVIEEKPKTAANVAPVDTTGPSEFDVKIESIKSPKCRTMLKIVTGREVAGRVRKDRLYTMSIEGTAFKEIPDGHPRKVLIFARYEETITKVTAALKQFDINYLTVAGTAREVADTLRQYKMSENIPVLIINAGRNCAGMDLDYVTDIIFMHYIIDTSILSQAVGRAQRMGEGRKYSLVVHMLLMENEVSE